jgi:hypothetical protein
MPPRKAAEGGVYFYYELGGLPDDLLIDAAPIDPLVSHEEECLLQAF